MKVVFNILGFLVSTCISARGKIYDIPTNSNVLVRFNEPVRSTYISTNHENAFKITFTASCYSSFLSSLRVDTYLVPAPRKVVGLIELKFLAERGAELILLSDDYETALSYVYVNEVLLTPRWSTI